LSTLNLFLHCSSSSYGFPSANTSPFSSSPNITASQTQSSSPQAVATNPFAALFNPAFPPAPQQPPASGKCGISSIHKIAVFDVHVFHSLSAAPPEQLYASQLQQLQDMGFYDPQSNIGGFRGPQRNKCISNRHCFFFSFFFLSAALQATGGNVSAAVDRLLSR
jgi:hypothetical protein